MEALAVLHSCALVTGGFAQESTLNPKKPNWLSDHGAPRAEESPRQAGKPDQPDASSASSRCPTHSSLPMACFVRRNMILRPRNTSVSAQFRARKARTWMMAIRAGQRATLYIRGTSESLAAPSMILSRARRRTREN